MAGLELTDEGLEALVDAFYARVRQDPELGPVFNDAVDDWPEHLEKLSAFWSSVMRTTGRYKGQPLPAHMKHKSRITPELFQRWLKLWGETSNALMTPDAAAAVQAKAARIAESLQLALFFRLDEPPTPYRSTPVFDQDTLPAALRARHDTRAGVWGVIRVIEGEVKLTCLDPASETVLTPARLGVVRPQQAHFVTPLGAMKMQIDFYDRPPR